MHLLFALQIKMAGQKKNLALFWLNVELVKMELIKFFQFQCFTLFY